MPGLTIPHYTENDFRVIESFEGVSVIWFHAPWCNPCNNSEKFFDEASYRMPSEILTGKVNVLQAPALAAKYSVWGLPNILIFKNGQVSDSLIGSQSSTSILSKVKKVLENNI